MPFDLPFQTQTFVHYQWRHCEFHCNFVKQINLFLLSSIFSLRTTATLVKCNIIFKTSKIKKYQINTKHVCFSTIRPIRNQNHHPTTAPLPPRVSHIFSAPHAENIAEWRRSPNHNRLQPQRFAQFSQTASAGLAVLISEPYIVRAASSAEAFHVSSDGAQSRIDCCTVQSSLSFSLRPARVVRRFAARTSCECVSV